MFQGNIVEESRMVKAHADVFNYIVIVTEKSNCNYLIVCYFLKINCNCNHGGYFFNFYSGEG